MLVLIACILPGTSISYGAIITEGDAFFSGEIYVAQQSGDGSLTITSPTVIDNAGGIFIANQTGLTGTVTVDGSTYRGEG